MSTVTEVIGARQCGLNVAAISCVTNPTAKRSETKFSHAKVLKIADRVRILAAELLENLAEACEHALKFFIGDVA